jgi:hypothetical protein
MNFVISSIGGILVKNYLIEWSLPLLKKLGKQTDIQSFHHADHFFATICLNFIG